MKTITMTDLIYSLRTAAASPEAHSLAQGSYFSELQDDSVLVNCGTACCIAGHLMLKGHQDEPQQEIDKILNTNGRDPEDWVRNSLELSNVESTLAFDPNTYYEIHLVLADLLEAGLRLPDRDRVVLSEDSWYTEFFWAYLEDEDRYLNLQETLDWMRSIAE